MNTLVWTFLIGCAVLLFTVQKAEGVKCYACHGSECKDPFKPEGVDIQPSCMGSCSNQKTDGAVVKACLPLRTEDQCKTEGTTTVCFCNSDLCNGSDAIKAPAVVIAVLTAVGVVFKKI